MSSNKPRAADVKRIYLVAGSKGGVGKSMLTIALLDMLGQRGEKVCLIDSDTSNPDVFKSHEQYTSAHTIDLDSADGWIELVNTCDQHRDHTVVINTAARNNLGIRAYGETLSSTLTDLERQLVTAWVINRQRDSLELLREFCEVMPVGKVHVVLNGHFGSREKFELYNSSKLRSMIESRGGLSMLLPDLADRVSDDLYCRRLSIAAAMRELPLGNRAELQRWRSAVSRELLYLVVPLTLVPSAPTR